MKTEDGFGLGLYPMKHQASMVAGLIGRDQNGVALNSLFALYSRML